MTNEQESRNLSNEDIDELVELLKFARQFMNSSKSRKRFDKWIEKLEHHRNQ